jgi:hypothetical protein
LIADSVRRRALISAIVIPTQSLRIRARDRVCIDERHFRADPPPETRKMSSRASAVRDDGAPCIEARARHLWMSADVG